MRSFAHAFLNCNRNKTGLVLDLKHPTDRDRLVNLVKQADVLVQNMRPAAAARLNIDHEELLRINPRLVYCAIVGYGQDGPYRERPAYDDIIEAASGWSSLEERASGTHRYRAERAIILFAICYKQRRAISSRKAQHDR